MQSKILFPTHFKRIGWMILIPSAILGLLTVFEVINVDVIGTATMFAIYSDNFHDGRAAFGFVENNISDEVLGILSIVGAIFVAFSKEKQEDEFIAKIRTESLVWATYINYAILIFCMLFFYSIGFLYVMMFNMFTILLFFIIRFYYVLYRSNTSISHEE